jgi:hypothetical protein
VQTQVRLCGRNFASPKFVCIDLQPYGTTQAPDRSDILNVGGFSDAVFSVVAGCRSPGPALYCPGRRSHAQLPEWQASGRSGKPGSRRECQRTNWNPKKLLANMGEVVRHSILQQRPDGNYRSAYEGCLEGDSMQSGRIGKTHRESITA